MKIRRKRMMILYTFFIIIASYFVLDPLIVLDRTDQALGEYDFVRSSPDAEVFIEGTGSSKFQMIKCSPP